MKQKITHSLFSVAFFAVGFLSLGYFVMTGSSAQVAPYIDMGINGNITVQAGTTYTTEDDEVQVFWMINSITSCNLMNQNTGAIIGSYTHTPSQYQGGVPAQVVTVTAPTFSGYSQSVTYSLRCTSVSGTMLSDSVTVTYVQLTTATAASNLDNLVVSDALSQTTDAISAQSTAVAPTNQTQIDPSTSSTNTVNPALVQDTATPAYNIPTANLANPDLAFPDYQIDLGINGQLIGVEGGDINLIDDHNFMLEWTANQVDQCRVKNMTTNTTVATQSYADINNINDSFMALGVFGSPTDYSYTYRITCYIDGITPVGSDTVTVNVDVPFDNNSSCNIDIDDFDVDQDEVFGNQSDDDVSLSWTSTSSNSCSHSCSLTYEGDIFNVSDNDNDYDVTNIDSDHTFVLECYEDGNPNNSVTSTEHVDYYSSSNSSSNNDNPELETLSAQQVGSATARLRGTYDDGSCSNLETGFLFGTNSNSMSILNGYTGHSGAGTITAQLQGLMPGTTYYYRHVGQGCSNISAGDLKAFTTTGSRLPYNISSNNTSITSTTSQSGTQQISVQNIAEDGTRGEVQFNAFDIGVGYVPDSNNKVRGPFPSTFGDWLLIIGMIGLLLAAGKFIHEAFTHPRDHHMPRY